MLFNLVVNWIMRRITEDQFRGIRRTPLFYLKDLNYAGEASSLWQRTGKCGWCTLLPCMSLRRKAHECVEFVKRKFISLLTWKTKGQSHDMAKKEDVAKLGPYVELKVFLRYLWISYSISALRLVFCE